MALNTGINSLDAGANTPLRLEGQQQAGGPYNQGSDVKNALAVWNNMGPEDRAGFEGFLDFFRSGAWRDQIQGMGLQERNMKMASAPNGEPFMMEEFLQAVKEGFKGDYDAFIDQIDRSPADYMAKGGRIGFLHGSQGPSATPDVAPGGGNGGGEYRGQATYMEPTVTYRTPTVSTTAAQEDIGSTTTIAALEAAQKAIDDEALRTDVDSPIGNLIKAPLEYSTIDDIGYDYPDYPAPIDPAPIDKGTTQDYLNYDDAKARATLEAQAGPDVLAGVKMGDGTVMEETYGKGPLYTDDMDNEQRREAELAYMFNKGLWDKDAEGNIIEGRNVRNEAGEIVPRTGTTTTGITRDTGAGDVPLISDLVIY